MKKILIFMMLLSMCITTSAEKQKNDTISINQKDVSQWIEEPYINSKGKEAVHYYAVWKGNLLTTTLRTIEAAELCNKYHAKCALIVIGKTVNGCFKPKRITIN